jgi:transposase
VPGARPPLSHAAVVDPGVYCASPSRHRELPPARQPASARPGARRGRGLALYLPPYSPDLNPVEHAFTKLKTLSRTAAARRVELIWHAIGKLLDAFSPAECAHYLAHAGYVLSNRETL